MAKRVKWEVFRGIRGVYHTVKLEDGTKLTVIDEECGGIITDVSFAPTKECESVEEAQRYCIREAFKLYKLVGTQLTQLAEDSK